VVVKVRVVRMTAYGAKAARLHLRYIERDGVDRDGSRGVLYGREGPERADSFAEPRAGEKHQFRMIVSPEDAVELDLTAYVRSYMGRVEKDLGQPLEWAAVNHYDTGHPHAHVVIRGVDGRGHEVRMDREYVSNGLRYRAQELATLELGPRTELELRRTREREIVQERYTSLDRELERRAEGNLVRLRTPERQPSAFGIDESTLTARLGFLEKLRLAERTSPTSWSLAEGWAAQLKETAARGDIIKQMHLDLRGDPSRYRIVAPGQALDLGGGEGVIHGRVAGKGLADELAGRYYAVIETASGMGYHVPLDLRAAEALRPGDLVSVRNVPAVEDPRSGEAKPPRIAVQREPLDLDAQVQHRGPVLLDELAARPVAPYGFGEAVRAASERRAALLRELGIAPSDPERSAKLRELERTTLGDRFAARSGQRFLEDMPATFNGRVELGERGGDGMRYAVVSDGARFVMVPAGEDLRVRAGQSVTLARGPDGKLRVRDLDKDRDR
jgi:type IV secretory pathway VirD2 relaxase